MEHSYWNNTGKHQTLVTELNKLVPDAGSVVDPKKNKALEKFRKASNVYYDTFNNGLGNMGKAFKPVFGFRASAYKYIDRYGRKEIDFNRIIVPMDQAMDDIIVAAAIEQGLM
jgi:hypothetical protein